MSMLVMPLSGRVILFFSLVNILKRYSLRRGRRVIFPRSCCLSFLPKVCCGTFMNCCIFSHPLDLNCCLSITSLQLGDEQQPGQEKVPGQCCPDRPGESARNQRWRNCAVLVTGISNCMAIHKNSNCREMAQLSQGAGGHEP